MVVLYSEIDLVDQFFLFDEELNHWNKLVKSGIHLCVNSTEEELDTKLSDPEDPIFVAFSQSATMSLPVALSKHIEKIKSDLSLTVEHPRSIFLLKITKEQALEAQKKYGTAVYSQDELPDNLFGFSYYIDLDKNHKIASGWKGILNFKRPLSNSLIISDNHYFKNQDSGINRGFSNLINFIDAFLPDNLSIEYHITIFAEDCDRTNDWWVKEFGKLTASK
jgi:hypothetical protein